MASIGSKRLIGAFIAGSMVFSSTGAMASAARPVQQGNPWAVLTALSGGAPAAAMCGAAAAAAVQTPGGCVLPAVDGPAAAPVAEGAPPPPAAVPAGGISTDLLVLGLFAVAMVVGTLLALDASNGGPSNPPVIVPVSPT